MIDPTHAPLLGGKESRKGRDQRTIGGLLAYLVGLAFLFAIVVIPQLVLAFAIGVGVAFVGKQCKHRFVNQLPRDGRLPTSQLHRHRLSDRNWYR